MTMTQTSLSTTKSSEKTIMRFLDECVVSVTIWPQTMPGFYSGSVLLGLRMLRSQSHQPVGCLILSQLSGTKVTVRLKLLMCTSPGATSHFSLLERVQLSFRRREEAMSSITPQYHPQLSIIQLNDRSPLWKMFSQLGDFQADLSCAPFSEVERLCEQAIESICLLSDGISQANTKSDS